MNLKRILQTRYIYGSGYRKEQCTHFVKPCVNIWDGGDWRDTRNRPFKIEGGNPIQDGDPVIPAKKPAVKATGANGAGNQANGAGNQADQANEAKARAFKDAIFDKTIPAALPDSVF
jgi:hypothetical protein